jgi:hypothetical protein
LRRNQIRSDQNRIGSIYILYFLQIFNRFRLNWRLFDLGSDRVGSNQVRISLIFFKSDRVEFIFKQIRQISQIESDSAMPRPFRNKQMINEIWLRLPSEGPKLTERQLCVIHITRIQLIYSLLHVYTTTKYVPKLIVTSFIRGRRDINQGQN